VGLSLIKAEDRRLHPFLYSVETKVHPLREVVRWR